MSRLPGPFLPSFPVIGQSYILIGDPFKMIKKLSKKYHPLYRFDIGPFPTVIITTKELMTEAFKNPAIAGRPYSLLNSFELMMKGKGLDNAIPGFAGSQGKNWKEQRHFFVLQIRSEKGSQELETIVKEEAKNITEKLKREVISSSEDGQKKRVSMHQFFMPATVNVVWRITTGQSFAYDDPRILDVIERIYEFFKFLQPGPNAFIQLQNSWIMQICSRLGIRNGLNTYMRLIEVIQNEIEKSNFQTNIFIKNYIRVSRNSRSNSSFYGEMGRINLVASLGDIFMGGADTTNNQLEWMLLYLAHYEDLQEKIRTEIFSAVGHENLPEQIDFQKLPFLQAFMIEVLRLRPIAPLALPRMTTEECHLSGHILKKNTQVFVDLSAILQDPEVFPDPKLFDPTRFLPTGENFSEVELISRVFGLGKRRCPGEKIARSEMFMILIALLQSFRFSPALDNNSGRNIGDGDAFHGIFGLNHVPKPYSLEVQLISH